MSDKAIVLHSGGQDSTTCLAWAIEKFGKDNIKTVNFGYGQKHAVEMAQANIISDKLGVERPYTIVVDALAQLGGAALTNPDIPVEAEASEDSGNQWAARHGLPSTFVPGRNLLFLTLAAAYGAKFGIINLVTGVCEADDAGYPDCREQFIKSAGWALSDALDDFIEIHAPLLTLNKARTFALAHDLGILDLVLEDTHTCYHGRRDVRHNWGYGCGECPACLERAKGYEQYRVNS